MPMFQYYGSYTSDEMADKDEGEKRGKPSFRKFVENFESKVDLRAVFMNPARH